VEECVYAISFVEFLRSHFMLGLCSSQITLKARSEGRNEEFKSTQLSAGYVGGEACPHGVISGTL